MDYANKDSRTNVTDHNGLVTVKARAYGDRNNQANVSLAEVQAQLGVNGIGIKGEAGAHFFDFKDGESKTAVKAFGAAVEANAGIDVRALTEKGKIIGYELKAKGTLVDCKAGPISLHLGAGLSSASKIEDGTLESKLAGCGIKIGKRIGFSVFDNELSLDTLTLVGKGWLWGQFD